MKKRYVQIALAVLLVFTLAGAAFVAGRLVQAGERLQAGANQQAAPRKLVTPAAGLPAAPPDVRGDAIRRDGNSIFVCESNRVLSVNPDGSVTINTNCTLEVEVVLEHDTQLIHDVSALHNPAPVKQGQDYVIRQVVEPGASGDIGIGTAIRAWGTRSGNRILARIVLYWNRSP